MFLRTDDVEGHITIILRSAAVLPRKTLEGNVWTS